MSTIIHTFFRKSLLNTEHHRGGRSHPPMFPRFESACLFCFGKRTLLSTGELYNASRAFLRDLSTVTGKRHQRRQDTATRRLWDASRFAPSAQVALAFHSGSHQHHCRDYSTIPTLEHQCFEGVGPSKEKSPLAAVPQVSLIKFPFCHSQIRRIGLYTPSKRISETSSSLPTIPANSSL